MSKFKINDRVCSKKLGLPCISTIYGILDGETQYLNSLATNPKTDEAWSRYYPEWKDKFVYYVKYDSPQRPLSLAEYILGARKFYAEHIAEMLSNIQGTRNRGAKEDCYTHHGRLGIIRDTLSYDFLLEMGFLRNKEDYKKVTQNGMFAVVEICKYLLDMKT